jgi:hypothetical protein
MVTQLRYRTNCIDYGGMELDTGFWTLPEMRWIPGAAVELPVQQGDREQHRQDCLVVRLLMSHLASDHGCTVKTEIAYF